MSINYRQFWLSFVSAIIVAATAAAFCAVSQSAQRAGFDDVAPVTLNDLRVDPDEMKLYSNDKLLADLEALNSLERLRRDWDWLYIPAGYRFFIHLASAAAQAF